MVGCSYCSNEPDYPYTCNYCGNSFCSEHRLPEKHKCTHFLPDSGKRFESDGPSTKDRRSTRKRIKDRVKEKASRKSPKLRDPTGGVESQSAKKRASKTFGKKGEKKITDKSPETKPDGSLERPSDYDTEYQNNTSRIADVRSRVGGLVDSAQWALYWLFVAPIVLVGLLFWRTIRLVRFGLTHPVTIVLVVAIIGISATAGTGFEPLDSAVDKGIGFTGGAAEGVASYGADAFSLNKSEVRMEIHKQVNQERAKRGLRNLSYSKALQRPAQAHSGDMANHSYFSHTSQTGQDFSDRYREHGVNCGGGGENIFRTTGSADLEEDFAKEVVSAWMNSPGHRENILRPRFRAEGLGIAVGDEYTYVTQNFC